MIFRILLHLTSTSLRPRRKSTPLCSAASAVSCAPLPSHICLAASHCLASVAEATQAVHGERRARLDCAHRELRPRGVRRPLPRSERPARHPLRRRAAPAGRSPTTLTMIRYASTGSERRSTVDVARGSVLERLYVGAQVQLRDDGVRLDIRPPLGDLRGVGDIDAARAQAGTISRRCNASAGIDAPACIISTAHHARPKVIGHMEPVRAQLSSASRVVVTIPRSSNGF